MLLTNPKQKEEFLKYGTVAKFSDKPYKIGRKVNVKIGTESAFKEDVVVNRTYKGKVVGFYRVGKYVGELYKLSGFESAKAWRSWNDTYHNITTKNSDYIIVIKRL